MLPLNGFGQNAIKLVQFGIMRTLFPEIGIKGLLNLAKISGDAGLDHRRDVS